MSLSSNLVFSKWDQIFKDPMTTMAAVDRLVHHAIILEFDGETMRVPRPKEKAGGRPGAPASPFGSAASLAPGGAKDSAPPKGLAQRVWNSERNRNNVKS